MAALALPAGGAMAADTPMSDSIRASFHNNAAITVDNQRSTSTFEQFAQRRPERKISASQAKSAAMSRHRGAKFINVQLVGETYRVRLQQKNGRIVDVYVDARTGRVRN